MHQRKPDWIRVRLPQGDTFAKVREKLGRHGLHTVCEEACCPSIGECWGGGTATIMLMGGVCTRGCRFCAVTGGRLGGRLDLLEPTKVAEAVGEWGLSYVVLTSVCRDDLPDGGAEHFAQTVRAIRARNPLILIETLIPDFGGNPDDIGKIVGAKPDVVGHNVETVRRLTPMVRDPRASYDQSLSVLAEVKRQDPGIYTKSSIMLGLGEAEEEVAETMHDLRSAGVSFMTIGQYLRPSHRHLAVIDYVHPDHFAHFRRMGKEMGFLYVSSGPLVRSSYRAGEYFLGNTPRRHSNVERSHAG